jgi:molybdenum cofactor guanylyltransferase
MNFSAAILAGGKNSRFNGEQKSFLTIGNHNIIDRTLLVLNNIFNDIIIVSNQTELYNDYSKYKIVSDVYNEIGPLGGIHAALQTTEKEAVFIVSCDMPFLNEYLINLQIQNHLDAGADITIPLHNGYKEPLHGIYNKEILNKLEDYIHTSASFKIRNLFNFLNVNYFEVPSDPEFTSAFTNINHPEDYQNLQKKLNNEIGSTY